MTIKIYTYSNPYELNKEIYWNEINECPYFCASQTLVNGLRMVYGNDFIENRVATITRLVNNVYKVWNKNYRKAEQQAAIENVINDNLFDDEINKKQMENAFFSNREEVLKSIRVLCELNVNPKGIKEEVLTPEQKCVISLYKSILKSDYSKLFEIDVDFDINKINDSIFNSLSDDLENIKEGVLNSNTIVIHGIHQFKPIILRTIEEISKYKNVILLFNYQSIYKSVYQTWLDVYSAFDETIEFSSLNKIVAIQPNKPGYESNQLSINIGKLAEGKVSDIVLDNSLEIIEFDNKTEFADYIAGFYSKAKDCTKKGSVLANMKEHFYSADSSVNDLLRIYFPEQFGERDFLQYPLGRFIVVLSNMWSVEDKCLVVNDLEDIKECLASGILKENKKGELLTLFNKSETLFFGCNSFEEIIKRTRVLKESLDNVDDGSFLEKIQRLSYCNLSLKEIDVLEKSFIKIKEVAKYLFDSFNSETNNIKKFYNRLLNFLNEEVMLSNNYSSSFKETINKIILQIRESDNINISSTFNCLKSTFNIFLSQNELADNSVNWISKDFEQIEGDVLRTKHSEKDETYHFACLSDSDLNSIKRRDFPWPLDKEFFEIAQNPVDWKYQVYVNSCKEYKNFKKFSLLYGLANNYKNIKLSYVKKDGDKEKELYYILKMLNIKVKKYKDYLLGDRSVYKKIVANNEDKEVQFNMIDYYKFRQCKYRFLFESLIENDSIYKDRFLQLKYLDVLFESLIKEKMVGEVCDSDVLDDIADVVSDELKEFYSHVNYFDMIDSKNYGKLSVDLDRDLIFTLTDDDQDTLKIKEQFLRTFVADVRNKKNNLFKRIFIDYDESLVESDLSYDNLSKEFFTKNTKEWCKYCPTRELCMEYYKK